MVGYIIALDQGTTSSRTMIFSPEGQVVASARRDVPQIYPRSGWVEHDPFALLNTQIQSLKEAFENSGLKSTDIAAVAVTNQRETTVVWDKITGEPVCNAVVWQCRRTAPVCDRLCADGLGDLIKAKTGLLPDAYFSGTKIKWILDTVPGAREKAQKGQLLFGTVDSWLIWNLTGVHATDHSNASRTMLMDIHNLRWDGELCEILDVPANMLPEIRNGSGSFGKIKKIKGIEALEGIAVLGCVGDQQAALFGQGCFSAGQAKNTYGTGCFTLLNTGDIPVASESGLLTSVGWVLGGKPTYVLEGSVFNGGSVIQWLRDGLKIIDAASECDALAATVTDNGGVHFVPAFTGMGAPYWDMEARGVLCGITRGTERGHIARAALEGVAFQVADLIDAMKKDAGIDLRTLRVDGGASASGLLLQMQADILGVDVDRPVNIETTAAGAAYMAGLAAGIFTDTDEIEKLRNTDKVFRPAMAAGEAQLKLDQWHKAVERAILK